MGRAEPQHRLCSHQPSRNQSRPPACASPFTHGCWEQSHSWAPGAAQAGSFGELPAQCPVPGSWVTQHQVGASTTLPYCHKDLFLCQGTALFQNKWKGAEVLPHGMLAQLALLRGPAGCGDHLESLPAPVLTGPSDEGVGDQLGTAAREKVPAGSERQSQILHASRVPAFFFPSCICSVLG